jgi:hypothetical protein
VKDLRSAYFYIAASFPVVPIERVNARTGCDVHVLAEDLIEFYFIFKKVSPKKLVCILNYFHITAVFVVVTIESINAGPGCKIDVFIENLEHSFILFYKFFLKLHILKFTQFHSYFNITAVFPIIPIERVHLGRALEVDTLVEYLFSFK